MSHTSDFAALFGGNCEAIEKNQLQKLQNRAARILTNSRYDADARPLLNILGLKTIQDLIDTETSTMVFKALNGLAPEYLSKLFIRNSETHMLTLRNTSTDLQLPKKRTSNWQKCFSYEGIKSWNCLSLEIKQASSLKVLKRSKNRVFFLITLPITYIFRYILFMICFSFVFNSIIKYIVK